MTCGRQMLMNKIRDQKENGWVVGMKKEAEKKKGFKVWEKFELGDAGRKERDAEN